MLLRKQLEDKEQQLKEVELAKWNLLKKKDDSLSKQANALKQKESELERQSKEIERLRRMLAKFEREMTSVLHESSKKLVIREIKTKGAST